MVIGPDLIAAALGDARAQALPPVSLEIPQIYQLDSTREGPRPERRARARSSRWCSSSSAWPSTRGERQASASSASDCLATAVLLITVGYLVPIRAVPALSDEPWLAVVPDVARDQQPVLIAVTVLLVGAGVGCLAGAGLLARRHAF